MIVDLKSREDRLLFRYTYCNNIQPKGKHTHIHTLTKNIEFWIAVLPSILQTLNHRNDLQEYIIVVVEITVVNGTIAIVANEGTIIETISKNSCNCVFSNCVHSSDGGGGNRNKPPPPPHTYTHNGQVKLSYPDGFILDQELDFALSNPPACVVAAVGKYVDL